MCKNEWYSLVFLLCHYANKVVKCWDIQNNNVRDCQKMTQYILNCYGICKRTLSDRWPAAQHKVALNYKQYWSHCHHRHPSKALYSLCELLRYILIFWWVAMVAMWSILFRIPLWRGCLLLIIPKIALNIPKQFKNGVKYSKQQFARCFPEGSLPWANRCKGMNNPISRPNFNIPKNPFF